MSAPIIGMEIPWNGIAEQYLRINHFTAMARVENGNVTSAASGMPYALLEVESPILPHGGSMPVVHRLDFYNLWRIFRERTMSDDEEILVVYSPVKGLKSLFAAVQPKLVLLIYPKGSMEIIYDPRQSAKFLAGTRALGTLHGLDGSI